VLASEASGPVSLRMQTPDLPATPQSRSGKNLEGAPEAKPGHGQGMTLYSKLAFNLVGWCPLAAARWGRSSPLIGYLREFVLIRTWIVAQ